MNEEQKNLKSVKGMTKWQRMRFEMLVSASGAFIRVLTYVIFIAMFLMLATRMQSQTWYNWKNDQRVAQLEERVAFLEKTAVLQPTEEYNPQLLKVIEPYEMSNKAPTKEEVRTGWLNRVWLANTPNQLRSFRCPTDDLNHHWHAGSPEEPHKAMRHYWTRENDHPDAEDEALQALGKLIGDKLFDKVMKWAWEHHPTEVFIGSLLIVGTLFILLFEGPMALVKLLFGKDEEEKKPEGDKDEDEQPKETEIYHIIHQEPPDLEEPKKEENK